MPSSSNVYLHPKLWFNILRYLFPEELVTVSMVSRRLYNIANDDRLWWPLVLEYFPFYQLKLNSKINWLKEEKEDGKVEKKNLSAKQIFRIISNDSELYLGVLPTLNLAIMRKEEIYKNFKKNKKNLRKGINQELEEELIQDLVWSNGFKYQAINFIRKKLIPAQKIQGKNNSLVDERKLSLPVVFNLAVIKNYLDVLYLLREAALTSKTLGKSLMLAARKGHLSIVKYLINHELMKQEDKLSAFKIAIGNNQLAIVSYLLENIKICAVMKGLALRWAAKKNYYKIVKLLLVKFKTIFDFLPSLKGEAWAVPLKMPDFNLYMIIKRNGSGFSGERHIVIINLDNEQTVALAFKDIEQMALLLQRKCFPIQKWNGSKFYRSYRSLMGIKEDGCSSAIIYCLGKIDFNDEIKKRFQINFPEINKPELGILLDNTHTLAFAFNNMQLSLNSNDVPSEKWPTFRVRQSTSIYLSSKLWFNILKYLLPEELVVVSVVNHRLYEIVSDNRLWWPHVLKCFPFYQKCLGDKGMCLATRQDKNVAAKKIFKYLCKGEAENYKFGNTLVLAVIRKCTGYIKWIDDYYTELKLIKLNLFKFVIKNSNLLSKNKSHRFFKKKLTLPVVFNLSILKCDLGILDLLTEAALTPKTYSKSLVAAIRIGCLPIFKYLINHKSIRQEDKLSAFKIAVGNNQLAIVDYLFNSIELDPIVKGRALRWATKKHYHEIVIYLLSKFKNIFDFLPSLKKEAWSELFKMPDLNLYVIIKRNGYGFSGESYVIIINLDDKQITELAFKDIEQIALWLQRKCFPVQQWDNSEFHQSYHCIIGDKEHKRAPAIIYCVGKIAFSNEVKNHFEIKLPKINNPELNISLKNSKSLTFAFNNMRLSSNPNDALGEKQQVPKIC